MIKENCYKKEVLLLVQPYFFAHQHFYQRKLGALRSYGLPAKIVAFVPEDLFLEQKNRYQDLNESDYDIVVFNGKVAKKILMVRYFWHRLKSKNTVIVHALRETTFPLIFLKNILFLRKKLRVAQEFEGDNRSEFVYRKEFSEQQCPPEYPKKLINILKYKILSALDFVQAKFSDGLILMSEEHSELWYQRLGSRKKTLIFSTLPIEDNVFFDRDAREIVRKDLGFKDQIVFVYVGNVSCEWQRLSGMLTLFKEISKISDVIRLLILTRTDDFEMVEHEAKKHGLENLVVLKNVPHKDIYKFLSASDVAFFLRHNHLMNKVVTSGKLGEYLASGMKVLTTGANSSNLNRFIKKNNVGIFISDDLKLKTDIKIEIEKLCLRGQGDSCREKLSAKFYEKLSPSNSVKNIYPRFLIDL